MKWITHQTGAVVLSVALQLSPVGLAAASVGAILPDVVDQRISSLGATRKQRQRIFNRVHRGDSHWFGWWLLLFLTGFFCHMSAWTVDLLAGVALGGLSHVFLDMLTTSGVPVLPFTRKNKLSLHLCATGKIGEYLFLAGLVGLSVWFMRDDALIWLKNAGILN